MRRAFYAVLVSLISFSSNAQIEGTEIGFDLALSFGTNGGNAGLGVKYGWKYGDYFIFGPSVRYQRVWNKNVTLGTQGGFNVYGGGGFAHARFANVLFLGTEFEVLRSPYTSFGFLANNPNWVPTWLLGGGFSMEFNEKFRLNAGVFYDVLDIPNASNIENNNPNSPLQPYIARNKVTGAVIPILYRINFFIPLD